MPDSTEPQHPVLFAGRYRLDDVLGTGGTSTVFRAYDTDLRRTVAIKLLHSSVGSSAVVEREQMEIRTLASLNHHSLVTLYDANVAPYDGTQTTYLVMEIVDGPSLAERMRQGPIAAAEAARWTADLAEALVVIHAKGVVHRDIKPANILLAPSPVPGRIPAAKLADFGIASLLAASGITTTGSVLGTAAYLSPEQALGEAVGPASDVYSLGLVVLEMLTGSPPFTGTMLEMVSARLQRDPLIPASVGNDWRNVLTAMTQLDPASRPTALELVEQLPPAASALLAAEKFETPTVRMPADTAVLPSDSPTVLLSAETTASIKAHRRRRIVGTVIGVFIVGFIAVVAALGFAGAPTTGSPAPSGTASTTPHPVSSSTPISSVTPSQPPAAPVPSPPAGKHNGNGHGNGNGNGNGKK
jgi:serine/threonine protein kinase